jgi:PIN domain nuclease of toxin-antitoxin system
VRLLLDTHTFLWMTGDPTKLTPLARKTLEDPANERFFSDASIWELAIKIQLGKLQFPLPFDQTIFEGLHRAKCTVLPITTHHVAAVWNLPSHHRDPFDRLLVIQTSLESLTLVTHNVLLQPYNIPILW